MQMTPSSLHCKVLLCSYGVGYGRTLQRSAHIEPPEFFERLVVISDHPTILQRCEQDAARSVGSAGSNFDVRYGFGDDLMGVHVVGWDLAVIRVRVVCGL